MFEYINNFLDIIGVIAFTISGIFKGMKNQLDIFGISVLGVITACGGGILRDIILNRIPTNIVNPRYIYISLSVCLIIYILSMTYFKKFYEKKIKKIEKLKKIILISDAIGLSIFTITGANIAISMKLNILTIGIMATLTGTFGGLLRDILTLETPTILKEDVYATLSFFGGIFYFLLLKYSMINDNIVTIISICIILIIRLIVIKYKIRLPIPTIPKITIDNIGE